MLAPRCSFYVDANNFLNRIDLNKEINMRKTRTRTIKTKAKAKKPATKRKPAFRKSKK